LQLEHDAPGAAAGDNTLHCATPAPDRAALILFTSGTTGEPKGVVHSFASLGARIELNLAQIPAADLARTLCGLPTHFGHGLIGNCLTALAAGGVVHLMGERLSRVPLEAGALIDAHDISFMSSVPTLWKVALKTSKPPVKRTLRRLHVGSAPLAAPLWRSIQEWAGIAAVVNMYGITETANWIAGADPRQTPIEDGLVGTMWGGRAAVLDGEGRRSATGEGEIVVATPSLMKGYWAREDLTAQVLRDGWYLTGDSGHIDSQGVIRLRGRRKDEINRAGMKVQPAEIDMLLERHPDVAEACCFGLPDEILGEKVAVAVRPVPGAAFDSEALRQWCRTRLHAGAVPERWFEVAEIPKTERGKIKRDAVMRFCLAQASLGAVR
jgi:acyl-coenzyme A synthetase/AMP-(fatty) acid ligase